MEENCSYIDAGSHSEDLNEAHVGDQEGEAVKEEGSFVDEGSQPVGFDGDQEPSWALSGAAVSSIEDHDEKMCAVGRWINDIF